MKRKRIFRIEEVIDFFCGNEIEEKNDDEIAKLANKMIKKQNLQVDIDNENLGIGYYDKLKFIENSEDLQTWKNLKNYIEKRLQGTEYLDVFRAKINPVFPGIKSKVEYLPTSKRVKMENDAYKIAENYVYSRQLVLFK